MKNIIFAISAAIIAVSFFAFKPSSTKNYEDCVLENMKGVESDSAARYIQATCRAKFPSEPNPFDKFD